MTDVGETVVGFPVAWIVKDEVVARQPMNSRNRYIPKGNNFGLF